MGMPLRERVDVEELRVRLAFLRDRRRRHSDVSHALKRQLFVHPWKMAAVTQAVTAYEREAEEVTRLMAQAWPSSSRGPPARARA